MLERALVKEARDWLRLTYGNFVKAVKIHGSPYMESGIPDLLICLEGRFIAAEAKRLGEKPSTVQKQRLKEYQDAGAYAFWFDKIDDFKAQILEATKPTGC